MKTKMLSLLAVMSSSVFASDLVYLECNGVIRDDATLEEIAYAKHDFLLDKDNATIQRIVTGLPDDEADNLTQCYKETKAQYISSNETLAINKHTLEFSSCDGSGKTFTGTCQIKQKAI